MKRSNTHPVAKQKTAELKRFYIKMIHTLKHNYFVDDECRKIYLNAQYGKDSLSKLSIEELRAVALLCGYEPKSLGRVKENLKARKEYIFATKKQLDTITGIWNEVARVKSEMALRDFIYRIVKIRPLHLSSLKRAEASDVIIALKNMKERNKDAKQL
ncbi:DUF1018 domain-containing protein [Campylobacter sp. RM12920]|uniref:DUF1018 domain-containing protein n=1 Tax=Campylobacter californiensis TaxID=1032243 RepID=A0ABD4JJC9_9BACT|nr:DUF1018 domain-containing protein [Campylobacter sp. RM12919]MBE2988982.1 DUF1018 domain-containing protein [Campylobacter sp. RM12920]